MGNGKLTEGGSSELGGEEGRGESTGEGAKGLWSALCPEVETCSVSPTAACGQRGEAEGRWGQRWPGPGPRRHRPLAVQCLGGPQRAVEMWPPVRGRGVGKGPRSGP